MTASLKFREFKGSEDRDRLITLAEALHYDSRMSTLPFSKDRVSKQLDKCVSNSFASGVLYCKLEDQVVGAAFLSVGPYFASERALLASVNLIGSTPSLRRSLAGGKVFLGLLAGIESWSKNRHAIEIGIHVTSGRNLSAMHSILKRANYQFIGGNYTKPLNK